MNEEQASSPQKGFILSVLTYPLTLAGKGEFRITISVQLRWQVSTLNVNLLATDAYKFCEQLINILGVKYWRDLKSKSVLVLLDNDDKVIAIGNENGMLYPFGEPIL